MNTLSKRISIISVRPILFQKSSFIRHNRAPACHVVEYPVEYYPKKKYYEGEYPKCVTCKHFTYFGKCKLFWYYDFDNINKKIYLNAFDKNLKMKCQGNLYEYIYD